MLIVNLSGNAFCSPENELVSTPNDLRNLYAKFLVNLQITAQLRLGFTNEFFSTNSKLILVV